MKREYKTPKAMQINFSYDEQVTAQSSGVALYGDPQQIGKCQQSSDTTCVHFWSADSDLCKAAPFSLR